MSFEHLRPKGVTVGKGGGHGGGVRRSRPVILEGGWGWNGEDGGDVNIFLDRGRIEGRVGDIGTHSSLPITPTDRGAYVDNEWNALSTAVDGCTSDQLTPEMKTNFLHDVIAWDSFYQHGAGAGWTTLSTIDAWYGKALGWRNLLEPICGNQDLPVMPPKTDWMSSETVLGGLTHSLETVAVIGALGVGLWFFWPALARART